jgi:uncharacterized protein YdhG (YjbR/CyaY superfamily)
VIQEHKKELAGYTTTKAIVSFPVDKKIPMPLVKKLVKASLKIMKDKTISKPKAKTLVNSKDKKKHKKA